jgi:hypothetical protein
LPLKILTTSFSGKTAAASSSATANKEDHGNSFKQAFIERYLETLLEKHKSDGNSVNLLEELSACRYD